MLPLKADVVRAEARNHLEDLPGYANTVIGDLLSEVAHLDEVHGVDRQVEDLHPRSGPPRAVDVEDSGARVDEQGMGRLEGGRVGALQVRRVRVGQVDDLHPAAGRLRGHVGAHAVALAFPPGRAAARDESPLVRIGGVRHLHDLRPVGCADQRVLAARILVSASGRVARACVPVHEQRHVLRDRFRSGGRGGGRRRFGAPSGFERLRRNREVHSEVGREDGRRRAPAGRRGGIGGSLQREVIGAGAVQHQRRIVVRRAIPDDPPEPGLEDPPVLATDTRDPHLEPLEGGAGLDAEGIPLGGEHARLQPERGRGGA